MKKKRGILINKDKFNSILPLKDNLIADYICIYFKDFQFGEYEFYGQISHFEGNDIYTFPSCGNGLKKINYKYIRNLSYENENRGRRILNRRSLC